VHCSWLLRSETLDRADVEATTGTCGRPVSSAVAGKGKAEGNDSGGAKALLLYLLDVEGRAEL
jgi:hypothetical protein